MDSRPPVGRPVITVGLLGLGVVGSGVARALADKRAAIEAHVGRAVAIGRVLVRDEAKTRDDPPDLRLTVDPDDILKDPDVDIVVEVMGGVDPALSYIQRALHAGKHVVTANKEVMAKHGPEVLAHALEHGVSIRFEASVGGGIPIIGPLMNDLAANEVTAVNAVINGTTNYMLTRMADDGISYDEALAEAKALGYAEADPSADVDGVDAAFKLAVLSSLAFRTSIKDTDVYREGIAKLAPVDFTYAAELGYAIKLLATGKRVGNDVQVRVHPAFLPWDNPLAKVDGVYNAVELEGDLVQWAMFQGPGAGAEPTASAVLGDLLAVARNVATGAPAPSSLSLDAGLSVQPMDQLDTKYYLRLRAHDRPGVMAQITKVLGDLGVSLASVIQKEVHAEDLAEIVITTHKARESSVQQAVSELEALDVVMEVSNLVRVEDGAR
ncbi:MAG: homoserine dehydrogenase [Dehalococcoidia bacterium]